MIEQALAALHKYFGFTSFRPSQEKIILSLLAKQDTCAIMPTGAGKSLGYQIPALVFEGLTLVVSPLISLMKDQVDGLKENGIPATYINSSLSSSEVRARIQKMAVGQYKLLYIAPERLESDAFRELLTSLPVDFLAIDEAHCVSQWGHDFRPSYLRIQALLRELKKRPVVGAFTATATPEVKNDIVRLLGLRQPEIHVAGFDRANLAFYVVQGEKVSGEKKKHYVLNYLKYHPTEAGIIYTATRKEADNLFNFLCTKGIKVGKYHAGMTDQERQESQESFLYDRTSVMIATNAFGMGIDKSNVRFVIHYNMPRNMESYYQEAGRGGRDGEPAQCILIFSPSDIHVQRFLIEKSPSAADRKAEEHKKLKSMINYCYTAQCLRRSILTYFGDKGAAGKCGNCGNCQNEQDLASVINPPISISSSQEIGSAGGDLFETLRLWRKEVAEREKLPAYIIFTDTTLREIAKKLPLNRRALLSITGVGEKKLEKYGSELLEQLNRYAREKKLIPTEPPSKTLNREKTKQEKVASHAETLELIQAGKTLGEIAKLRNLSITTIENHLVRCSQEGLVVPWDNFITPEEEILVLEAVRKVGNAKLKPIKDILPAEISYLAIKAVLEKNREV